MSICGYFAEKEVIFRVLFTGGCGTYVHDDGRITRVSSSWLV